MKPKKSITDILKERNQSSFVGRSELIKRFEKNLELQIDHPDRCYIFNIHGQGGIGKTWLSKQLIQIMERQNAVVALLDWELIDALDALGKLASQIEKQGFKIKRFSERYKVYLQKKAQLESDPNAPDGIVEVFSRGLIKAAFIGIKSTPAGPLTDFIDQSSLENETGKGLRYLLKKITNKDEQFLILNPIPVLTSLFLEDLNDIAENHLIGIWIDTFEQTGRILGSWVREIFKGEYGDVPLQLILIISGRDRLRENDWADFQRITLQFPLDPFTEAEARYFLSQKNINSEKDIQVILRLSMRLPMLLNMLAVQRISSSAEAGDVTGTAVERFLQWIEDPLQRSIALDAALPRFINIEIIEQLGGSEKAHTNFEWLHLMPFVEKSGDDHWVYHSLVRELMLRHKRQLTPNGWFEAHGKLASYYETSRDSKGLDKKAGMLNPEWQSFSLEAMYHRFCQSPSQYLAEAVNDLVLTFTVYSDLDLRWANTIRMAELDCQISDVDSWGKYLVDGIEAYYQNQNHEKIIFMCDLLLSYTALKAEHIPIVYFRRGKGYHAFGKYEQALPDKTRAIELDPKNARYWDSRSATYLATGQYEQAITDITYAISLEPHNAEFYYFRGVCHYAIGQFSPAIADLTRAIELDPRNAEYYQWRGTNYLADSEYVLAIADANKALELNTKFADAYFLRGTTYRRLKDLASSIKDLESAMNCDPDQDWNIYHLALSNKIQGHSETALAYLAIALEKAQVRLEGDHMDWDTFFHSAQYMLCLGEAETAEQLYFQGISQAPSIHAIKVSLYNLSEWVVETGDLVAERLLSKFEKALEERIAVGSGSNPAVSAGE